MNYLQMVAEELSKDTSATDNSRLACYYGYLNREMRLKNRISTFGSDPPKRRVCKRCFGPLVANNCKFQVKDGFLVIICPTCGMEKRNKITKKLTHYQTALELVKSEDAR